MGVVVVVVGHSNGFNSIELFPCSENKPEVDNLTVTGITPESFDLSWTATQDSFDDFVVEVTDEDRSREPVKINVPGDLRKTLISGLSPKTPYTIYLYGTVRGQRMQPISVSATTGIRSTYFIYIDLFFYLWV